MSVYRCGRCNRPFEPEEERVHSTHSRLSYCISIDACGKRADRWSLRPEIKYYAIKP